MSRQGVGSPAEGRACGIRLVALFGALTGLVALTACTATPAPVDIGAVTRAPSTSPAAEPPAVRTPEATEEAAAGGEWIVTDVVDGDTIDVTAVTAAETVRIVGIDTPERGECGFAAAAAHLGGLIEGVEVVTLSGAGSGTDDRDRYGRILRYVEAGAVDVGLALIKQGLAIARYDSVDTVPDVGEVNYSSCAAARAAGAAPVHRGQPGYGSHLDRDHDGIGCE